MKSVIVGHIVFLNRGWAKITRVYKLLNGKNNLSNQINDFLQNFESQDEQLKKALETLVNTMQN